METENMTIDTTTSEETSYKMKTTPIIKAVIAAVGVIGIGVAIKKVASKVMKKRSTENVETEGQDRNPETNE